MRTEVQPQSKHSPKTKKMTQTSFNVYTITSQFIEAKSLLKLLTKQSYPLQHIKSQGQSDQESFHKESFSPSHKSLAKCHKRCAREKEINSLYRQTYVTDWMAREAILSKAQKMTSFNALQSH